jgi:hypothetical protein
MSFLNDFGALGGSIPPTQDSLSTAFAHHNWDDSAEDKFKIAASTLRRVMDEKMDMDGVLRLFFVFRLFRGTPCDSSVFFNQFQARQYSFLLRQYTSTLLFIVSHPTNVIIFVLRMMVTNCYVLYVDFIDYCDVECILYRECDEVHE